MATQTVCITQTQTKPIKILKWKISASNPVSIGRILLLYDFVDSPKSDQRKLKSQQAGTVRRIVAAEGDIVKPGEVLFELEPCSHPTIMNDMCAECGADLRRDDAVSSTASVPMVHAIPDLKVSEELAKKIGKADNERLLKDRKLVLLVDLDQTLIHTTNDNIPANLKNVHHFQLYGPTSPWYHTRLRPRTHEFLNNIYDYFELHICTFGARNYAHMIAFYLDENQRFFSNRILSRDECFDPTSKKANLKALFPCGDDMVCIIDDREDVWSHASNLIHVKPYHFFKHTGDINAPPGLDKQENDDKEGVDLTDLAKLNGNSKNYIKSDTKSKENEIEIKSNEKTENVQTVDEDIAKEDEKNNDKTSCNNESVKNHDKASSGKDILIENRKSSENGESKIHCETELSKSNITSQNDVNLFEKKSEQSESQSDAIDNDKKAQENNKLLETNTNVVEKSTNNTNSTENSTTDSANSSNDLIEVEDPDDYLIYLEDILKRIHKAFYDEFDKMQSGAIPDLKKVIPTVRSQVLKDCNLVFSGLVPTHLKLEQSKAYQVARSLGAKISQDLEDDTTHLVAVRPGTAKVNAGRRKKHLKIVTPDWLWCCAERWEHVDERIFPLNSKGSKNRHPPPHCSSPDHIPTYPEHETPAMRKRTPSGRFMDTINPLMSFSSDDIADMDKEVEDILDNESSDDEDKPDDVFDNEEKEKIDISSSSSSSDDSLTGEFPKGFKRKRIDAEIDEVNNSTEDDESPVDKFRRGETVEDECDMEAEQDSDSVGSLEPPDEVDDGEWNIMGAALEREFLSNN